MPIVRAQVIFQGKTNKPEDQYVNTYHFVALGVTEAELDAIQAQLVELYNTTPPLAGSNALRLEMSSTISRATEATKTKMYYVAPGVPVSPVTEPNPPAKEYKWSLGAPTANAIELPPEMAVCASFYAGQNVPRKRGRVYLGPWAVSTATDLPTTDQSVPATNLRTSIASAFGRLVDKPDSGPQLAVYSRADGLARVVTAGWVDDAWDVQRRRGHDATQRHLFPSVV